MNISKHEDSFAKEMKRRGYSEMSIKNHQNLYPHFPQFNFTGTQPIKPNKAMKTILLLFLLSLTAQAQTFTILPSATTKVTAPNGWTGQSLAYHATDRSFSAPGGLWIPDVYNIKGGFYMEMNVLVTKAKQQIPGCLVTKAGSFAIGINYGKTKLDYISGSADQINGMDTLPVNQWVTVAIGIDTVGRVVGTLKGIPDIRRNTLFRGQIPQSGDKWNFLQNFPGRCRSIKVWAGSKPSISPTGFDSYVTGDGSRVRLRFARIDRAQVGQPFTIIAESPNGQQSTLHTGKMSEGTMAFDWSSWMNGNWTFVVSTAKHTEIKSILKGNGPIMPTTFTRGMYSVNATDYRLMQGLGVNTVYSDFPINNNPPNYKQLPAYLDSAKKYGLQSVVRMGLQASKGNLEFTKEAFAWYAADEASGLLDGVAKNFWACNAAYPNTPVIINLNNFARLDEASECGHILGINVYSSGRQVYDITRKAVALRPTFVTLPQYQTPDGKIFYTVEQMLNLQAQAVVAGAIGVFWFTWDDRRKSEPGRYYTVEHPERVKNLQVCFDGLRDMPMDWQPIVTLNPNVVACKRGTRYIYVNLTSSDQTEGGILFQGLEVKEF